LTLVGTANGLAHKTVVGPQRAIRGAASHLDPDLLACHLASELGDTTR
jgi:hypothetical protein